MFNTILNVKNRKVLGTISLEKLIDDLRNPSFFQKIAVDKARTLDKKSKEYEDIKKSLPCFVPNFLHKDYVKTDTIEESTGFIYIDVDYEIDLDFSKYDFIAASWKSLSGIGSGLLVAIDNYKNINKDLKTLRLIINSICEELDIKPDNCAISRDRLNVIGYDLNAYYNPNFKRFNTERIVDYPVSDIKKEVTAKNININNRLESDYHFYDGDFRLSNLEELKQNLSFKDDELFIDMSENPLQYTSVYIPKSIPVGSRNSTMFKILSTIRALNPNLPKQRFVGIAAHINNTKCFEPIENQELLDMTNKILNKQIPLFPNKMQKYPFNPIYTLTGRERISIASAESNRKKAKENTDKIKEFFLNWDSSIDGKFTYKALSKKSGLCYRTVRSRKKELESLLVTK